MRSGVSPSNPGQGAPDGRMAENQLSYQRCFGLM